MWFSEFDRELVRQFYRDAKSGEAFFHDPRYPYTATITRRGKGYRITIEDTRKRWWWPWSHVIDEIDTDAQPVPGTGTRGPAWEALLSLQTIVRDTQAASDDAS